ncbi:hypothetical protein [Brevundimonas sp.]|uniref:hypothetical protein n=1 Tax=Brevundimonas sp. TaxID=1871086 RepID=UPI002D5E8C4B|nr:hypothetical protein [Brevundimonas sp.]HYC66951.1 hypothetical protein [Brevundimonas sp.]
MLARALITALFGFSSLAVGAAAAWSVTLLVSLGWGAVTTGIPQHVAALWAAFAAVGIIGAAITGAWTWLFAVWVRQLPSLRRLTFALIATPFAVGFVYFGYGILSVTFL